MPRAGNGVQIRDKAHQRRASAPARPAVEVVSRRKPSRAGRDPPSIAAAITSRTIASGARITIARRATSAAAGSPSIRIVKPIRRSRAAASAAGSAVGKGARAMERGKTSVRAMFAGRQPNGRMARRL